MFHFLTGGSSKHFFSNAQQELTASTSLIQEDPSKLFTIYIRKDHYQETFRSSVYTVEGFLGDIGGLVEALFFIGYFLVAVLDYRKVFSELISKVYQVKKNHHEEKKLDSTK